MKVYKSGGYAQVQRIEIMANSIELVASVYLKLVIFHKMKNLAQSLKLTDLQFQSLLI